MNWRDGYIAVDWGTTNRRAYAVDQQGQVVDSFEDDCGVTAISPGRFEAASARISERLGKQPMLMAGMIGSNRGWREAPYFPCPAGIADLATSMLWLEQGRIGIVPGVCQTGASGADVMRGEEVQVLGAVAARLIPRDCLVCHPGTHAKWIVVGDGRITAFRTMMTGELFSLLRQHSILAEQLREEALPGEAFAEAARAALGGAEPLAALFGIRARHLIEGKQDDAAATASGLLIGRDVRAGLELAADNRDVVLVGRPDLCALYAVALREGGRETSEVDGATAFLAGIRAIAELL